MGTSDTPAIHFIEKAMEQSENEVDATIDQIIAKVIQNGD